MAAPSHPAPGSDPRPEHPTGQAWQQAAVPVRPWSDGLRLDAGEFGISVRIMLVLAATGVPAGLVWFALAPRREFEVVEGGFRPLEPQSEALIGADGWLLIVTGVLGVVAAVVAWRYVRARGVGVVLALAVGIAAATVVAWQVGAVVGAGPSEAELSQLGSIVTPALQLRAIPVLVIGAFLATLTYLVAVCFEPRDDLGRVRSVQVSSGWSELPTGPRGPARHAGPPAPSSPAAADVTGPPAGPRSDLRPAAPGDPRP